MRFLDGKRILSNIWAVTYHLTGQDYPLSRIKEPFIAALSRAQRSHLRTLERDVYIDFDDPQLVSTCVRCGLLKQDEVDEQRHLLPHDLRKDYRAKITDALDLVNRLDPHLRVLIGQLIGSIACYRIPDSEGGSVSSCVGFIYLSPRPEWPTTYYSELLVHEFVHNSVFLEDMVHNIFPNHQLWTDEDAMVTSAIRKTRRGYDKSYHSACVAIGLMYFHHLLGNEEAAVQHLEPLRRSIDELIESDQRLRSCGKVVLSDNGRTMLDDMQKFAETVDYGVVTEGVRWQH
jgi:hypothetical protein